MRYSKAIVITITLGLVWSPTASRVNAGTDDPLVKALLAANPLNGFLRESADPDAPIDALWGDLAAGSPDKVLETAQEFIQKFGAILGFPQGGGTGFPSDQLKVTTMTSKLGQTLVLTPLVNGAEFTRGKITLQFGSNGHLVGVNGRFHKLDGAPPPAPAGTLSAQQAVEAALAALSEQFPGIALSGDGSLQEYVDETNDGSLAYRYKLDLTIGEPPRLWNVLLDQSGKILSSEFAGAADIPDGTVIPGYPGRVTDTRPLGDLQVGNDMLWHVSSPYLQSITSYPYPAASIDGHFAYPLFMDGTNDPAPDNQGADTKDPHPWFLEANCYYGLKMAHDKAKAWGIPEVDNHVVQFNVWELPRYYWDQDTQMFWPTQDTVNNAYFSHAHGSDDWSMHYFKVNPGMMTDGGYDLSVTLHEYGHYVERVINDNYDQPEPDDSWQQLPPGQLYKQFTEWTESRAVAEGWADYFSASILDYPDIGLVYHWRKDRDMRPVHNTPPQWTYWAVTPCYDSFKMCNGKPCQAAGTKMEIHDAGRLFSGACWEIREKLGNVDDAMNIVVQGLRFAPTPVTFKRAAWGIVVADNLQNIFTPNHTAMLIDIFQRRGMWPGWDVPIH